MKPTLLVMAAGMGSRYGGLKQLDGLGPNGETIMDYSIYDALQSGFGKIVFVIRRSFEEDFRKKVASKYQKKIPIEIVFQELDDLPAGFTLPDGREKPWGTNHALLMGEQVINEPFGVINADDFYGRESFQILAGQLSTLDGKRNEYCMVGYMLGNTLSDSGSVARGVCEVHNGYLSDIIERLQIERIDGVPCYKNEDEKWIPLTDTTPVSMNMWGFTPDYFEYSRKEFIKFLDKSINIPKSEFLIPTVINDLVTREAIKVRLVNTPSCWFGVTYPKDRPEVVQNIKELVDRGVYPQQLF